MAKFKIHPAIGIARLGDSESEFYLSPEGPGHLPIACDSEGRSILQDGKEKRVEQFRDAEGRIKRQAARFRVYVYDGEEDKGREVKVGDTFQFELSSSAAGLQAVEGTVTDISWTVHLANKKSSWYRFQETTGIHGYKPSHPLRSPEVTQPDARRDLIIDPGPVTVSYTSAESRHKTFAKGGNPGYPQRFPPADIWPSPISTLILPGSHFGSTAARPDIGGRKATRTSEASGGTGMRSIGLSLPCRSGRQ